VLLIDGSTAVVTGAELEKLEEPIKVYNLEVEDYNTFFVGDEAVLVHNYPGKGHNEDQQAVVELAKEAERSGRNGNPISESEANILLEWADEYGLPHHGPEIHPERPGPASKIWHFHIDRINHIIIDMSDMLGGI
jgi:hypothetical protein